ncbi:transporter family-2 protein [Devosia crocina]|uniref:Transporter family-2 protein n=1 Tax=Devosia crocina TaxID=429728 RepID=A0A1I7N6B5_9HYPH|nr:DMT family transporter [Devosia crocina]SFV30123.1 transporter family-2 protein [Devosia crocina]
MILPIVAAFAAGLLVILSRQVNGRLSLSTTPMISSFWNHIIGAVVLTVLGLALGNFIPADIATFPWWIYLGGAIGVVFVASGSWLITRIGAVNSTLLVISGQMVSGVIFDLVRGAPVTVWASALGVLLIIAGMALTQRSR